MPNFDNRPALVQLIAYYKGDYNLRFTFTQNGVYSLVGAAAAFTIYDKNSTSVLALTGGSGLTINGAGGYFDLAMTNAQVVALNSQEYNIELILTLSGGTVWPVIDGTITVSEYGQANTPDSTISVTSKGVTITITQL
jgi:hypothetical protein